ncbi:MAG: Asp-tRNA(Asn)/Glu-tRNA(Gln) amidotransferase subunit GatB [Gammaproteobacteria bacterium]|nr:Asp-tRNA(Asn)/Glu-tRNA(Gln) amidotransferase subunit GatB [Gammaproteobacteria bacterium]
MEWETVIGLEVHVQLATKSKIFSGSATKYGAAPNTQANIVDLGFPGVLPVLNQEAVTMACKFGLAVDAEIAKTTLFARKNYFYPDLPKGYQISQLNNPVVGKGVLKVTQEDGEIKTVGITRAHLEEDAGKSLHEGFHNMSGIDLNRAGIALLEIVSEPDLRSAKEAVAYLKTLHSLVKYLEICDGNMQEGSFRCDANVSVRKLGASKFGTRAEIKNVNSFKFVEKAINYEVARQIALLDSGQEVVQETRLYDSDKDQTRSMRSKEEATDYRYFPDPDLLPVEITAEILNLAKKSLPELPEAKKQRFITQYKLTQYDAEILTSNRNVAEYYEAVLNLVDSDHIDQNHDNYHKFAKLAANWVMGELMAALNKNNINITNSPILSKELGVLILRICDNTISGKIAKQIFETLWENAGKPNNSTDQIINDQGLKQVTDDSAIKSIIDEIIKNNADQVAQYKSGKIQIFGFFVGQVMKASKGKANPEQVNHLLKDKLSE